MARSSINVQGAATRLPLGAKSMALNRFKCPPASRPGRPSFWERPSHALPDRKGPARGSSTRRCRAGGCQCNGKGDHLVIARALCVTSGFAIYRPHLCLCPRFGALSAPIGTARPLAGERPIRINVHGQDHRTALTQTGHRQHIADDLAMQEIAAADGE